MSIILQSVACVISFYANRNYSKFDVVTCAPTQPLKKKLKAFFKTILHPLVRDNFTPAAAVRAQQSNLRVTSVIALRKEADDRRPFDHFVAF